MTEEQQILAAIKYVEENDAALCPGKFEHVDHLFVGLAKSLAGVLKAKLVKVEDGFGKDYNV